MAGQTMGIRVMEHLIIGEGCYSSLADLGYMERLQQAYKNRFKNV
jgi:hypothetical protein